jgi:hypothetical protein
MAQFYKGLNTQIKDAITIQEFPDTVEKWDVWPQGPRLQGEDGGEAGARGGNKTTEQPNNRTSTRHRNIIDTHIKT